MTTAPEGRGAVFSLSWECVCQGIQFFFFFATVSTEDHKSMSIDFKDINSFYWIDEAAKTESENNEDWPY